MPAEYCKEVATRAHCATVVGTSSAPHSSWPKPVARLDASTTNVASLPAAMATAPEAGDPWMFRQYPQARNESAP
jgi:hypothetical protein